MDCTLNVLHIKHSWGGGTAFVLGNHQRESVFQKFYTFVFNPCTHLFADCAFVTNKKAFCAINNGQSIVLFYVGKDGVSLTHRC